MNDPPQPPEPPAREPFPWKAALFHVLRIFLIFLLILVVAVVVLAGVILGTCLYRAR